MVSTSGHPLRELVVRHVTKEILAAVNMGSNFLLIAIGWLRRGLAARLGCAGWSARLARDEAGRCMSRSARVEQVGRGQGGEVKGAASEKVESRPWQTVTPKFPKMNKIYVRTEQISVSHFLFRVSNGGGPSGWRHEPERASDATYMRACG